jgi:hypothetical protein
MYTQMRFNNLKQMLEQSKEYKEQVRKWMLPIEQSIIELRDVIRADNREVLSETQAATTSNPDQLSVELAETDYVTIDQAIKLPHMSKPTLHCFRKEHSVRVSRVGRRVLFKRSDLMKAIKVKHKTNGGKYLVN